MFNFLTYCYISLSTSPVRPRPQSKAVGCLLSHIEENIDYNIYLFSCEYDTTISFPGEKLFNLITKCIYTSITFTGQGAIKTVSYSETTQITSPSSEIPLDSPMWNTRHPNTSHRSEANWSHRQKQVRVHNSFAAGPCLTFTTDVVNDNAK